MRRLLIALALLSIAIVSLLAGLAFRGASSSKTHQPAGSGPPPGRYLGSQPPKGIQLPSFRLRDYRGRFVSSAALRGNVILITFLDTACKAQCPIVAAAVGSGLRLLTANVRRQLRAVAISVDPPRDTPARVRSFLARRHALALAYLSGGTKALRPIWKAFGVLSATETGNADVHSSDVRLFDRAGEWVSTMHAGVDLTPRALAHDIKAALEVPR
jgi:cytochrome oxidase Cu insertion factor (SCO1/SenC/PrrC family)